LTETVGIFRIVHDLAHQHSYLLIVNMLSEKFTYPEAVMIEFIYAVST